MSRKSVLTTFFLTILIGTLGVAFNVQNAEASGIIYIRADGSIDPPTAPISSVDNVTYTFANNINDSIVVERNNIVVDGAGHIVQGTGASDSKGISLSGRSNVTIKNTNVSSFYYGIWLYGSSNYNSISGNTITNNSAGSGGGALTGIYLYSSSNNNISGNEITNNWIGINLLEGSDYNSISGNTITDNDDGIELGSINNSVSGNIITNNSEEGMRLYASFNTISGNLFTNDGLVVETSGNVVEDNFVNGKPLVYLEGISHQSVGDAGQVILVNCEHIQVNNLNLSHTTVGIELRYTNNTTISGNNITANNQHGILLSESSNNNSISGNRIANNNDGIWLSGDFSGGSNNSIVGNNITANKRTGLELYSSNNTIISGNNITDNAVGILGDFYNNTIAGNNITNNSDRGIYLDSSLDNSISGNNITANSHDGIFLFYYSKYNSISGNNITNNGGGIFGGSGIYLYESSNNSISGNVIANNSDGIMFDESSNSNTILANNITANSKYGIYLEDSSNNSLYHNNFINNAHQVYDFWAIFGGPFSINAWENDYPSGGNYWSDYAGTDSNHDGIGDTAYIIDANNTDRYPLMTLYIIPEFPSFLILPLFFIATLLAVIIYIRKHPQDE